MEVLVGYIFDNNNNETPQYLDRSVEANTLWYRLCGRWTVYPYPTICYISIHVSMAVVQWYLKRRCVYKDTARYALWLFLTVDQSRALSDVQYTSIRYPSLFFFFFFLADTCTLNVAYRVTLIW
jgi:hypothetical protein